MDAEEFREDPNQTSATPGEGESDALVPPVIHPAELASDAETGEPIKSAEETIRLVSLPPKRPRPETADTPEEIIPLPEKPSSKRRTHDQLEKARRRQSVYLQKRREKKKRRIIYNRIRTLFRLVFCLVLTVGAYFLAVSHFWHFSPDQFRLHGGQLLTQQHLLPFITPLEGKPLYEINPTALQKRIRKEIPLVEKIYVRRHLFPVGLDVTVAEKPSWGILYDAPPIAVPRPDAPPETQLNASDESTLPKDTLPKPMYLLHWDNTMTDLAPYKITPQSLDILDHPVPLVSTHTALKAYQIKRYRQIASFLKSVSPEIKLLYLDISNPGNVVAFYEGFKISLGRADSTVMTRLARLTYLVPAIKSNLSRIDQVDLRWNQQVIFKKRSQGSIYQENPTQMQGESPVTPNTALPAPASANATAPATVPH